MLHRLVGQGNGTEAALEEITSLAAFQQTRVLEVPVSDFHVREEVLKQVKPGSTHRDLQAAYEKAVGETGFRISPHSQMHQYGIDVPEFPGPGKRVAPPAA